MRLDAQQPGRIREHRPRVRLREPLALEHLEEHLRVAARHVGVALALGGRVAEVTPAVDHLLRRAAADPELQPAARNEVCRARVLRHVQRVLVAHVDDGRADLDRARPRADGREQRERRAELAREMVHAEVRAVGAQLLGGDGELDRLEQRVGRRAYLRAVTSQSNARTTGIRSSSTAALQGGMLPQSAAPRNRQAARIHRAGRDARSRGTDVARMDVAVGRRTGVTSVVRDPRAIEWRELVPLWLAAGLWGLLAGSALLVGAAIGYFARVPTALSRRSRPSAAAGSSPPCPST